MTAEFRVPQGVQTTELAAAPAPEQLLAQHRESLRVWDAYWRDKVEDYGAANDTAAMAEVEQIRGFIRDLAVPRLDQVAKSPPAQLGLFLKLMIPFDAQGGLKDFLLHFFQLEQGADGQLAYRERDPYERDVFVLHDLYKVRKTLEVVDTLRMARGIPARRFPSRLREADIRRTLDGLTDILQLLYRQCLPPEHVKELVPRLGPGLFHGAAVLERREAGLRFALPHVLEKYDYRRFFFLLYFKSGLRAKVGGEAREFRYNFLYFQILKQEFLQHWLTVVLRDHPQKFQAYQRYTFRGKTLLEWIVEAPEQEADLLAQMGTPAFESVAGEVNERVPDELKVGAATESATTGFYFKLKQQLAEAAAMAAAPLEALRQRVAGDAAAGQVLTEDVAPPSLAVPGAPRREPAPAPKPSAPPEASPAPPAPPKAEWEVIRLDAKQVPMPFLTPAANGFNGRLREFKQALGRDYDAFAQRVKSLLESSPEAATVCRQAPKHEWTMPFLVRHNLDEGREDYLVVLGAEVKAKSLGMGYGAKQSYDFSPYLVFAVGQGDESFGRASGERKVQGRAFTEYAFGKTALLETVRLMLDQVWAKLGR